jgi:HK97 family phage prohead protease
MRRTSTKHLIGTITKASRAVAEPEITISTPAVDRDGDTINPLGVDFANYMRTGGPVLFGHQWSSIPVGRTTSLRATPQGLHARFRWLEGDPDADRVRNAWQQDVLKSASIGFVPLEPGRPNTSGGFNFERVELVEWSIVGVPSNPTATRLLKQLGLDVTARALAHVRGDEVVLHLEDDPVTFEVLDLRDALQAEVRRALVPAMRSAITQLTGRVD